MPEDPRNLANRYHLTAEQVTELERSLLNTPHDAEARTRLLIHYMQQGFHSQEAHKNHVRHILWVIANAPETPLAGTAFVVLQRGRHDDAIREAKPLWLRQVANHPDNAAVLGNAAKFILHASPQDLPEAQRWLQTAATLDPTNPEWPEQSGRIAPLQNTNEPIVAAQQALRHFERAYELTADEGRRVLLLDNLARNAYTAQEYVKAGDYATSLLQGADICKETQVWNYGNALHWSHIVLGKVALQQGDLAGARLHLRLAGETPGSPQLNSFGPDRSLAKELLEHKEKEAVLAYFEACAKFWALGQGQLTAWVSAIRQDLLPDFTVSCRI